MPGASKTVVMNVTPEQLLSVVTDYERYPEFVTEAKRVSVEKREGDTAVVAWEIEQVKRLKYRLRCQVERAADALHMRWSLIDGDLFKQNDGSWVIRSHPQGCEVTYRVEVQVGGLGFMPQAIVRSITDQLTNQRLPAMMGDFQRRAESLFPRA